MKQVRAFVAFAAVFTVAAAMSACSMQARHFKPTSKSAQQIGLPMYPQSVPLMGQDIRQTMYFGRVHTVQLTYQTSDDPAKVANFYQHHLPKYAQKTNLPFHIAHAIVFQFMNDGQQKNVMIFVVQQKTMVQLRSTTLPMPSPDPQPSG